MALRFTVLASGSAGNASLIEADDFGLLLDVGLGPRVLASRLAAIGASWSRIHAVLLTHTHSDHWCDATLSQLWQRKVPLYCHPSHRGALRAGSRGFQLLEAAGLVHDYEAGKDLTLPRGLRCLPLPVSHDCGATFGFRVENRTNLFGDGNVLGYVADLGCWDGSLAASLAHADLLALEFNHDVAMEVASGRSPSLVSRVLGDEGHLSNEQAAALLKEVLHLSGSGRPRHLVQLHLSRDCNRPLLAEAAARTIVQSLGREIEIHTARQHEPSPTLVVSEGTALRVARTRSRRKTARIDEQSWLPGLGRD